MAAVHRFDLSALPQDHVDILIPIVPTDEEIEQFKEYAARNNGTYEGLSVEDQFMAQLMNIERLAHKLKILSFMAGFEESVRLIEPVCKISRNVIYCGSRVKNRKKFFVLKFKKKTS
jgi:hypothetical protein